MPGPARRWAGRPPPKPSTSSYCCSNKAVLPRPLEPKQYTSLRYTTRLAEIGAAPSIGTGGDSYDNSLAESTIGLFKTELIRRHGPWRTLEEVELATLGYIDWFNHHRLHGEIGDLPPAELEATYYRQPEATTAAGNQPPESLPNPGRFRMRLPGILPAPTPDASVEPDQPGPQWATCDPMP